MSLCLPEKMIAVCFLYRWEMFSRKAVGTIISSVSLMTLLTSDHLKCHCSAVAISIQYHKADYHLCSLPEALQSSVCEVGGE
jgi:hypothetical protein